MAFFPLHVPISFILLWHDRIWTEARKGFHKYIDCAMKMRRTFCLGAVLLGLLVASCAVRPPHKPGPPPPPKEHRPPHKAPHGKKDPHHKEPHHPDVPPPPAHRS